MIEDHTKGPLLSRESIDFLQSSFPNILRETLDDYNVQNKASMLIECKFPMVSLCYLWSEADVNAIWDFKKENATVKWKAYRAKYGTDSFFKVSSVGFSKNGQQGLAFVSRVCGTTCADQTYYLLANEEGNWKIASSQLVGVS